jgi:hypothetical protein
MKAYRIQTFFSIVIFISFVTNCPAQLKNDSAIIKGDSLQLSNSIIPTHVYTTNLDSFLKKNKYLNVTTTPVSLAVKEKNKSGKEFLFYIVGLLILILALFKVFYAKYFNNIFKVFFNTSLRQNQLTDLLLQAKLPSLIFNILFIMSAGLYAWLLLNHYHLLKNSNNYIFISISILSVGIIYFGKFLSIKLIGWISGMSDATDQYIFVIFLINKIIGILLIPFIILLAFAPTNWITIIIISSFAVIGVLFILRYLRSYGLLQNQLKINIFHFLLYIIGMEFLPVLIIYKLAAQLLLSYV